MNAYNNHVLSQGALDVARATAERDERAAVVAFLRRQAAQASDDAADLLRVAALVIENGDHHK